MEIKRAFLFIGALLIGSAWYQGAVAQETQALYLQDDSRAVGAIGGYMSSGETTLGFGGVVMQFGAKFDGGILYAEAPSVQTYGIQVGRRLLPSEDQKIPIVARVGGRLESMQIDFQGGNTSAIGGGVDFTVGLPFQQGAFFIQPSGTVSLSVVPEQVVIVSRFGGGEVEVSRVLRPSASVGMGVGASGSRMTLLVEPAAFIPITEPDQETVFGAGCSLLVNID